MFIGLMFTLFVLEYGFNPQSIAFFMVVLKRVAMVFNNSIKRYDVAVVGGGPAGANAAFYLAKQGVKVALMEKEALPRYKPCGGGITQRTLGLLDVDISDAIERACHTVRLSFVSDLPTLFVKRDRPLISTTSRDRFDFLLVAAAENAGAQVYESCKVLNLDCQTDDVSLYTSRGRMNARFVIAADGATSVVAKKAGWKETRRFAPTIECEISATDQLKKNWQYSCF
jgi:flavin-dependent dehydrogenase